MATRKEGSRGSVIIAGAGLAGLTAAKELCDRGYTPTVLEERNVLGGKVAAWQDDEGDWYETGLHIFFGAYPNMLQLFQELGIRERLQWKKHAMIFAMPQAGRFSRFDFPNLPGPFNGLVAILSNSEMISLPDKLKFGIALIPAILKGQDYVEEMDNLSISEWLKRRGAPPSIEQEIFIAMAKALAFVDPDKVSATVVLTALNRFLQEGDGSKIAFLDGAPPERLCKPLVEYIEARGGRVLLNRPVERIEVEENGLVRGLRVRGIRDPKTGEMQQTVTMKADKYISCVPVHIFKKLVQACDFVALPPLTARSAPDPQGVEGWNLKTMPVINLHLWFDKKIDDKMDQLLFSRSKLLSVYADMSNSCREYHDPDRSMLELTRRRYSPLTCLAGEYEDWIGRSDEDIVSATMKELEIFFPEYFGEGAANPIRLRKYKVVKTPLSVYWSRPGMQKNRPSQVTPISNFFLGGDYTFQRYLASMEGAVLSGKLVAEHLSVRFLSSSPYSPSSLLPPPSPSPPFLP
ncbi:hypothetical protein GUITHDRAFT_66127 [Guillardia theta CCMP2712]|uniref:15-cis-phytoene desaturase, chloroplastic/chromoplastic n=1 Tax=Guillardia theta (strain CCMP2712) TaxID=905079 RepID=L1JRM1_GUITC|nr:hypothetical protein GUITHDRAFT_66127 [Guillardia theta CCMP2712]EKX51102.1 hypothetical protein GUITHDRAFT_66127 [Guillardia theta CCMP2712]|eukprot:XP_005838082.1 hypothetical protein GUITHDRAFT_66127 [Guillardia theta CCMP2712]